MHRAKTLYNWNESNVTNHDEENIVSSSVQSETLNDSADLKQQQNQNQPTPQGGPELLTGGDCEHDISGRSNRHRSTSHDITSKIKHLCITSDTSDTSGTVLIQDPVSAPAPAALWWYELGVMICENGLFWAFVTGMTSTLNLKNAHKNI